MFDEIDYNLEGQNAERFATLYSHGEFAHLFNSILNKLLMYSIYPSPNYGLTIPVPLQFTCCKLNTIDFLAGSGGINSEGSTSIKVPKVYWNYTCKTILTLEWIDGIKLTDAERISKANLNRKRMIDEVLSVGCLNVIALQH